MLLDADAQSNNTSNSVAADFPELWIIRHNPKEHPSDIRPLSAALPGFLNDEPVKGKNVVLFYALHLHHLPRTEDWPGMPVEWAYSTLEAA